MGSLRLSGNLSWALTFSRKFSSPITQSLKRACITTVSCGVWRRIFDRTFYVGRFNSSKFFRLNTKKLAGNYTKTYWHKRHMVYARSWRQSWRSNNSFKPLLLPTSNIQTFVWLIHKSLQITYTKVRKIREPDAKRTYKIFWQTRDFVPKKYVFSLGQQTPKREIMALDLQQGTRFPKCSTWNQPVFGGHQGSKWKWSINKKCQNYLQFIFGPHRSLQDN